MDHLLLLLEERERTGGMPQHCRLLLQPHRLLLLHLLLLRLLL
jgi:hypothetical protein